MGGAVNRIPAEATAYPHRNVNFMPDDEAQRVRVGAYGVNHERLAKLKATYDPANLYRLNQNVAPKV